MDSCCVPGALNFCKSINTDSLDTCEGARYSCYIDPDLIMVPCSFDQEGKYVVSLRGSSIEEAWNSGQFEVFRNIMRDACKGCGKRNMCLGGCPLMPQVVLCKGKGKQA